MSTKLYINIIHDNQKSKQTNVHELMISKQNTVDRRRSSNRRPRVQFPVGKGAKKKEKHKLTKKMLSKNEKLRSNNTMV